MKQCLSVVQNMGKVTTGECEHMQVVVSGLQVSKEGVYHEWKTLAWKLLRQGQFTWWEDGTCSLKTWAEASALVSVGFMTLGTWCGLSGFTSSIYKMSGDVYFIQLLWRFMRECSANSSPAVLCFISGWTKAGTQAFCLPDRGLHLEATFGSHCHHHLQRAHSAAVSSEPWQTLNSFCASSSIPFIDGSWMGGSSQIGLVVTVFFLDK